MKNLLLIVGFLVLSCAQEPKNTSFTDAQPQKAKLRNFLEWTAADNINLTTQIDSLGHVYGLKVTGDRILLYDDNKVVWMIDKERTEIEKIVLNVGRGPGELLNIRDLAAGDDRFYISDTQQRKLLEFDYTGRLITERTVAGNASKILITGPRELLAYTQFGEEHLFTFYNPDETVIQGEQTEKGFEFRNPEQNMLSYEGKISGAENAVFFGGYSEPILKKYDTTNGNLLFSVQTMDYFDSSGNYDTAQSGEFMVYGYADNALYAVQAMDVNGDNLYVKNYANGNKTAKAIDIYSAKDGAYQASFNAQRSEVLHISADDEAIYTIETNPENGHFWLTRYDKP